MKKQKRGAAAKLFQSKIQSASHSIHSLAPFSNTSSGIVQAIISVHTVCPKALKVPLAFARVVHLLQHLTSTGTTVTFS